MREDLTTFTKSHVMLFTSHATCINWQLSTMCSSCWINMFQSAACWRTHTVKMKVNEPLDQKSYFGKETTWCDYFFTSDCHVSLILWQVRWGRWESVVRHLLEVDNNKFVTRSLRFQPLSHLVRVQTFGFWAVTFLPMKTDMSCNRTHRVTSWNSHWGGTR